ncbi:MAG: HEAT repeat domain-containing protein [bacterium]
MTHENIKELVNLSLLEELGKEELLIIENHLLECDECRLEHEEQKKMFNLYAVNKPKIVNERQLVMARVELLKKLQEIKIKKSIWQNVVEYFEDSFVFEHKLAFGSFGSLLIGLFVGYFVFSTGIGKNCSNGMGIVDISNKSLTDDFSINNVSFITTNAKTGEIELGFEAVKKVYYKGNFNDAKTKKLLAMALTNSDNDGVKMKSINTISSQDDGKFINDYKIKDALINTVKLDKNPGVRREALLTLTKFPADDKVRDAFLFVLSNDTNSGLRIEAINAINQLHVEGYKIDEKTKSVLTEQAANDDNKFIRVRAALMLKEVI